MRHFMLCIFMAIYCSISCAQGGNDKSFSITGKFFGGQTKVISCSYRDAADKWITKECKIVNGRFSLNGIISGPTTLALTSKLALGSIEDSNYVDVFIESGKMEIFLRENHFKSIKVNGSSIQDAYDLLERTKRPIYAKLWPIDSTLNVLNDSLNYFLKTNDSVQIAHVMEKRELIFSRMDSLQKQFNLIELKYVADHPNKYMSAFLLEKQYTIYKFEKDSAKYYCNIFSSRLRNSYWMRSMLRDIKRKEGSAVGMQAKDFVMKDINGSNITLSAFKGKKVVIIDFWASWCIPCRESIPHLKILYDKYQSKGLAIIAVSEDKDKEAWLKAIEKGRTNNWYHVLAITGKENIGETGIGMKYEATPIPMCYLINTEGIIVGKWLGQFNENDADIDNKLKAIFGF